MEIKLAKTAGFCFGVERAVNTTLELSEKNKVCTYGPIIHNKNVTDSLLKKGVKIVDNFNDITNETIILRSHGVSPEIYNLLEEKKIKYVDSTCPFVKKIHKIVFEKYNKGYGIIIVGDGNHPEIIGINGYASNKSTIINNISDIKNINFANNIKYCLVSQTTFQLEAYNKIVDELLKLGLEIEIYNTICNATKERQEEADSISKIVDKMLIIGDKNSSNTKKLFEISVRNCDKSYLIESVDDLELNIFSYGDKIGITAGASTPPGIIKEAISTMSELNNQELSFEEMLNQSIVTLHTGDIVKGTVIRVSGGEISVNLGYKSDGIVTKDELSDDPSFNAEEHFKAGDEIEVYVLRVNDGEGNVQLSLKKIASQKNLEQIEQAFNNKEVVSGKIIEIVKGGLMSIINGVKVFVPSSQISNRYVEDLKVFLGEQLNFNILEFDPSKRRIVAGRKELAQKEEDEKKQLLFDSLEIGKKLNGTVRRIVDFGAFVDLGGIDGLIHISELSWGRVKKVKDVLKEGDEVEVTIIDFNKEKGKISLSLKDVKSDPWNDVETKYAVGMIVEGKVARMVPFGAFVELEEGVDGLVHISQIATKHVVKPEDELKIGEVIQVKVTALDKENKRISLSKKEVDEINEETSFDEATEELPDENLEEDNSQEEINTEEE